MRMTTLLTPTLKKEPAGWQDPGAIRLLRGGYALDLHHGEWSLFPLGALLRDNVAWTFIHAFMDEGFQQLEDLLYRKEGIQLLAQRVVQSYRDLPLRVMELRGGRLLLSGIEASSPEECQRNLLYFIENLLENMALSGFKIEDATLGKEGAYIAIHAEEEFAASSEGVECPSCGWYGTTHAHAGETKPFRTEEESSAQEVFTPGAESIDALCSYLKVPSEQTIKTMFYMAEMNGVLQAVTVLIRGDRQISERKLVVSLGATEVRIAEEKELIEIMGQKPGFLGPIGLPDKLLVIADSSVEGCKGVVTGANRPEYHLTGVTWGRDFKTERVADIALLEEGMDCPHCGSALRKCLWNGIAAVWGEPEDALETLYQDQSGSSQKCALWKGWIHLDSIITALARQKTYPLGLAPFDVDIIVPSIKDETAMELATNLYHEMVHQGVVALFDDRNERAGAKFADFELFGIPAKVVVGRKAAEGIVEVQYGEEVKEMQASHVTCFLSSLLNDDDTQL
ncbi:MULTISPECIES: YbaK/EbsC family protein [Aminobacterium]|jgi:prolyl-tRNA synthetase|uniref:YbaK/EbsC family protein n=1 Tax=Aminobacterium TaxID=81466 RepID=UPI00257B6A1E|nr:YbaK/EbsC family protein [Aminobacterium sp. UBA4987]